jgi:FAD/FMN-containing dehydrogenase
MTRTLDAYSTDRSVLKIRPKLVAMPETVDDVRKLVRFANQLAPKNIHLPITVRGTGLDKTGAAIGLGMVISMENMNKIQEIDVRQRLVRLQAGVTLGELNAALSLHGLRVPIAAHPNSTIGGLIANFYAGPLSHKYGTIFQFIDQSEIVLSSGDIVQTERLTPRAMSHKKGVSGYEGDIYRKIDNLINDNAALIKDHLDGECVDSTGYGMLSRVRRANNTFDLLPLFYASQGTLGVITEVIMSAEYIVAAPDYFAAEFKNPADAIEIIIKSTIVEPAAVNIVDLALLEEAAEYGKPLKIFKNSVGSSDPGFLVVFSFDDAKKRKRLKKIKMLTAIAGHASHYEVSGDDNYELFSCLDQIFLAYLNNAHGERPPICDDVRIERKNLLPYLKGLAALEKKYKTKLPIFGSALTNNYSVRPAADLGAIAGRQFVLSFLRDYSKLVASLGGSVTGGSPEGRVKAMVAARDPRLTKLYADLKATLDPNNILNPGIKHQASTKQTIAHLRTSALSGYTTL